MLTIFTALVDLVAKLLEVGPKLWTLLKKANWQTATIIGLLLFIVIGGAVLHHKASQVQAHFPTPEAEHANFNKAITAARLIDAAMSRVRTSIGSDRVVVNQFSNGQVDLSGLPFTKSSVTHVSLKPGVGFDPSLYQAVPLSTWNEFLFVMWERPAEPVCHKVVSSDVTSSALRDRYKDSGVQVVYACPITTIVGGPVGIISAGYLQGTTIGKTDEEIFAELRELSRGISGYLVAAKEEPKKWWEFW